MARRFCVPKTDGGFLQKTKPTVGRMHIYARERERVVTVIH